MTAACESTYLDFRDNSVIGAKTRRLLVISKQHGDVLGEVKWFGRWRQYAFFPAEGTVWNPQCMTDVQEQIRALTQERRQVKRRAENDLMQAHFGIDVS